MSVLSFLKSASVEEVKPSARSGGSKSKQWQPNPTLVAVRLWKDGSVFPSKAAIDKFGLEYCDATITTIPVPAKAAIMEADGITVKVPAKPVTTRKEYSYPNGTGNGLDVISSKNWNQFKTQDEGAMLFVAVVPKDQPKVDLFSTANYDEHGKPKVSVEEQGAATFGKNVLIPMVEDVYGITFQVDAVEAKGDQPAVEEVQGVEYVDLVIFEEMGTGMDRFNITEHFSKPIIFAPKRIARGDDKGKDDYERRENVKVYGFAPVAMVFGDTTNEAVKGTSTVSGIEATVTAEKSPVMN